MLASGNGKPMQCVANLLRITRGECTYDRTKGIDPSYLDQPVSIAEPLMRADAKWLIEVYEPRVDINTIELIPIIGKEGDFAFEVNAKVGEL